MFNSFSAALAALKAHSSAVDTIGHNLANVNTTGFKAVEVAFKDLVAESMGGGPATGMGVGKPIMVRNFTQGAIQGDLGRIECGDSGQWILRRERCRGSRTVYARWKLPGRQDRCHSDADRGEGPRIQGCRRRRRRRKLERHRDPGRRIGCASHYKYVCLCEPECECRDRG